MKRITTLFMVILLLLIMGCRGADVSDVEEIVVPERMEWSNCDVYLAQLADAGAWQSDTFGVEAMFPPIPGEGDWCGGSTTKAIDRYLSKEYPETLVFYLDEDLQDYGYTTTLSNVTERKDDVLILTETKIDFTNGEDHGAYRVYWEDSIVDIVDLG